jgi:hypothetical protein
MILIIVHDVILFTGKYIFGCFDNSDSKNKYQLILE